jgi:hypothetical protein
MSSSVEYVEALCFSYTYERNEVHAHLSKQALEFIQQVHTQHASSHELISMYT